MTRVATSRRSGSNSAPATPPVAWQEQQFHTIPQSAAILKCSEAQLYAMAKEGRLPIVRNTVTGRTLIATADLLAAQAATVPHVPGSRPRGRMAQRNRHTS